MRNVISLAGGAAALALMAGCATHGGYYDGGVAVGYDGYYDDYYGPFVDGYWNNDGYFYFSDGHGHWRRDQDHHFRRDAAPGFHAVHGNPSAHGGHDHGQG